ncbi:neutral zinc metallopeptidase [Spirillospora sp. CA-253888]
MAGTDRWRALGAAILLALGCATGCAVRDGDASGVSAHGPAPALRPGTGCAPGPAAPGAPSPPPRGERAATGSPLYRTGPLCVPGCRLTSFPDGGFAGARAFLRQVHRCLDQAWTRQFAAAGLRFSPPAVEIWRQGERRVPCGRIGGDIMGLYCSGDDTAHLQVIEEWHRPGFEAEMVLLAAHEYGHHVQYYARIGDFADRAYQRAGGKAATELLERRLELQAECLAAAFAAAVRTLIALEDQVWEQVLDAEADLAPGDRATHGGPAGRRHWMESGFRAGGPGGCDTWSAPAHLVAS